MASNHRNRGAAFLRGFQWKIATLELLYFTCFLAVFFVALLFPFIIKLNDPTIAYAEQRRLADEFLGLHQRIWIPMGILFLLYLIHSTLISHRIIGPLYRFKKIFREISGGNLRLPIRVRKHDYLHDEAQQLNEMVESLIDRLGRIKESTDDVRALSITLESALARNDTADLTRAARRLSKSLQRLQSNLDQFQCWPDPSATRRLEPETLMQQPEDGAPVHS